MRSSSPAFLSQMGENVFSPADLGLSAPNKRTFFRKQSALSGYRAGLPSSLGSVRRCTGRRLLPSPRCPHRQKKQEARFYAQSVSKNHMARWGGWWVISRDPKS